MTLDARTNLQTLLQGLGATLNTTGTAAENASQDPITRNLTGGQALNKSLQYSTGAFRGSAIVNEGLLGTEPHDLSKAVEGNSEVFRGFANSGQQLASFVHTFNATMATLASRQQELSQTIGLLPPLLRQTESADTALDASFGPTQQFAREFLPGVKQLGPTITVALPWIAQATALASPSELGGLLKYLTPAVQNTSSTIGATKSLLIAVETARQVLHPQPDPDRQRVRSRIRRSRPDCSSIRSCSRARSGSPGASGNFDGNGRYVRSSARRRGHPRRRLRRSPNNGPFFGNAVLPPLGTRPAFTGSPPPLRRNVACYRNRCRTSTRRGPEPGREARDRHPPPGLHRNRRAVRRPRSRSSATSSSTSPHSRSPRAITRSRRSSRRPPPSSRGRDSRST